MKDDDPTFDSRLRVWIAAFVVSALLIAGFGYTHYRATEDHVYAEKSRDLAAIGTLKAEQITVWRRERLADAIRFAQGPTLTRAIEKADDSDLHTMLVLNRKGSLYEDTLLLSPSGVILKSATDGPIPTTPATKRAVEIALATRSPTLSDCYVCASDGILYIDTAAPVCEVNGRPTAAFILRSNAEKSLYPMLRSWPVGSTSAEMLLVRREGTDAVILNVPRYPADASRKYRIPLTRTASPAVQAVLGKQGLFRGKNYLDIEVLADLRPIPDSDWFMVAQVDRSEIQAEVRYSAVMTLRLAILGILFVAAAIAFGNRQHRASLYRNLYRAERDQRTSAEKFRTILYSIGDAVITSDDKGCVQQMNAVAEQLTGWSEAEAFKHPLDDIFRIVNEETRAPISNPVWRVLQEGHVVGVANHTVLIARDGQEHLIADSGAPIRDEGGALTGVVLVFRDQTAEYAAQKALQESKRRLATLMNNLPGMAYRCDCDTYWTMRFVSDGCQPLTGYSPVDLIDNAGIAYADLIHPDDRQHVWDTVTQAVTARQAFTLEYRIHTADWSEKWVWERGCAIVRLDGSVEMLEGFITDISDRKQASEEQAKHEEQLHQSQKIEALGRLAGGIAHDFNNMLAIISGNTELIVGQLGNTHPAHTELHEILTASHHSAELVKQLLAFASKQAIIPQHLNITDAIADVLSLLRKLIGEAITLEWHPGNELWSVLLDPGQLDQILNNLVINARDAIGEAGRISLETRNVTYTLPAHGAPDGAALGDYVLLSVSDTGCGMDASTRARIFEPFFTTKQMNVGTGLGLPTVYGIVKQNRGFIEIDSTPGHGSRFDIYLPRHDATAPQPLPAEKKTPAAPPQTRTVLLVEDEPALLRLTQTLLQKLGYTVLAASCPEEAIEQARTFTGTIHLLLTDVVMPGMNGRDLWHKLSQQKPDLKTLFMSGYTADILSQRGVTDSHFHFIQKPFTIKELTAKLRETFSSDL
ncbi:MAG: PAS domain S-box protein [bacterium]